MSENSRSDQHEADGSRPDLSGGRGAAWAERNESFTAYDDHDLELDDEFADNIALVARQDDAFKSAGGHGVSGRARDTGTFQTFANLVKSFMGSGLLGLPHAFKEGGLVGSLVIMVSVCLIATACNLMLVRSKQLLARRGVVSFSDVAVHTYGRVGGHVLNFLLCFTQFGFCCVYLVFCAANLTGFIPLPQDTILFMIAPLFVLMSYIRSMSWISPFSAAANVTLVLSLCIIVAASIIQLKDRTIPDVSLTIDVVAVWRTLPVTFGMAVYAYEGIGVVLPCETAMTKPDKFPAVVMTVMVITFFFYTGFGAVCYLAFGAQTSDLILENMVQFADQAGGPWHVLTAVVRGCLIFTVAATFPVQLFVVSDIVEQEYMFKDGRWRTHMLLKANIFRTLLVAAAVLVAWLVPHFGPLMGIIGGIGSAALQFIFPSLFYLKLFPEMSKARRAACVVFVVTGAVGGILGTIDSISQLVGRS